MIVLVVAVADGPGITRGGGGHAVEKAAFWTGARGGTRFHALPFQCTITVFSPPVWPTAQALLGEMAATPLRMLPSGPGFGLGTRFQFLPFQRAIKAAVPLSPGR